MSHTRRGADPLGLPPEPNLLHQGMLRLRRLFVQVANIVTLRTDTITERTSDAGVTIDRLLIKDVVVVPYAADAEASDTYVITLTSAPLAYVTGQMFHFTANTANTGAATLNVNALGAKAILKLHDTVLANNDIEAGQIVTVIYDGTQFQMQSQVASAPAAGAHGPSDHTEGTAWRLLYLNGSGDETELVLSAAGSSTAGYSFLRGTGASAAPEFQEVMWEKTIIVEDPTSSEDIGIHFFHQAVTVREVHAVVVGSSTPSCTVNPKHHTDRSNAGNAVLNAATAITNTTTGQTLTSFTDATIPVDSFLWLETTAKSGTVGELQLTFRYTLD